jgi:hypothetical protein
MDRSGLYGRDLGSMDAKNVPLAPDRHLLRTRSKPTVAFRASSRPAQRTPHTTRPTTTSAQRLRSTPPNRSSDGRPRPSGPLRVPDRRAQGRGGAGGADRGAAPVPATWGVSGGRAAGGGRRSGAYRAGGGVSGADLEAFQANGRSMRPNGAHLSRMPRERTGGSAPCEIRSARRTRPRTPPSDTAAARERPRSRPLRYSDGPHRSQWRGARVRPDHCQ